MSEVTPPNITLRVLERLLGYSRTTISAALRGVPKVSVATAEKIREAAAAAGYQHNPLAGAIMSEMRRSRGSLFRGTLAIVGAEEPERPLYATRFHEQLMQGARSRAHELGFESEVFWVGTNALSLPRLDQILQARGIVGLVFLPTWRDPDYTRLDWKHYTGIYLDYRIESPALRCISCDHFKSMILALETLLARGYQRPGLFLPRLHDLRLQQRWEGAFLAYQRSHFKTKVPPLVVDQLTEPVFARWFKRYLPDVVIGHLDQAVRWMENCGAEVPKTHGFFCLNLMNANTPCAGLDQEPAKIGARGVEVLVAQLQHNDRGIPEQNSLTTLVARWVEGPTLLPQLRRAGDAVSCSRSAAERSASGSGSACTW